MRRRIKKQQEIYQRMFEQEAKDTEAAIQTLGRIREESHPHIDNQNKILYGK